MELIARLGYLHDSAGHRIFCLPGFRTSEASGPTRQLALLPSNWARNQRKAVVNSHSSSQWNRNDTARATGRHRAPARIRKSIKIITAAAVAAGVAGAFVGYKAESGLQADPVAKTVATYHRQTLSAKGVLAAGSAQPIRVQHAASGKSDKKDTSAKSGESRSDKPAKKAATRHSVKAARTHRSGGTSKAPAPSAPAPTASPSPSPSKSSSGSANLKAEVRKDIADGNYELAVGQYLVENGYSKAGAAGVVGCIDGESGGNPESVGSGGGGLIGWTPLSAAAPNPNIVTGNPATDMMTQLEDLLYYNSTEIGQSLVNQLNAITDPAQAADFFSQNFEKPAVLYSDVRPSTAEQIYSELGG
jgi:Phage tail lysozyme